MTLKQTVFFSISNFWYKLTQPIVQQCYEKEVHSPCCTTRQIPSPYKYARSGPFKYPICCGIPSGILNFGLIQILGFWKRPKFFIVDENNFFLNKNFFLLYESNGTNVVEPEPSFLAWARGSFDSSSSTSSDLL